jgi:hypothetical protein
MKRSFNAIIVAALVVSAVACGRQPATANADSTSKAPDAKVTIIAGTKLWVALLDSVSSDNSRSGDQFTACLAEPVVVDGKTVFGKGTRVGGRVIDARESGRVKGRASIELMLTEIMLENGKAVSISTKPYTQVAESRAVARGREIHLAPETRLVFALASPIEI